MSQNNEVVDLTADIDQGHDSQSHQPTKSRLLPASVLPSAPFQQYARPFNAPVQYNPPGLAHSGSFVPNNTGSRLPSYVAPPVGARPLTMAVGSYLPAGLTYSAPPRPVNNAGRLPSYGVPPVGGRTLPATVLPPSTGLLIPQRHSPASATIYTLSFLFCVSLCRDAVSGQLPQAVPVCSTKRQNCVLHHQLETLHGARRVRNREPKPDIDVQNGSGS